MNTQKRVDYVSKWVRSAVELPLVWQFTFPLFSFLVVLEGLAFFFSWPNTQIIYPLQRMYGATTTVFLFLLILTIPAFLVASLPCMVLIIRRALALRWLRQEWGVCTYLYAGTTHHDSLRRLALAVHAGQIDPVCFYRARDIGAVLGYCQPSNDIRYFKNGG